VIRIQLLGKFRVEVDGKTATGWPSRRAAELVQLLALSDGRSVARDQAIEALFRHLDVDAGAANLRKAAHHARQALGDPDAVALRSGRVELFPAREVETDAGKFEVEARAALESGDPAACARVADAYGGELLPEARYEDWTHARREALRSQWTTLLRRSGQWQRLADADPTDELAHRELMRRELDAGSRPAAIRWYGRLRTALRRELGITPSAETEAIYDECVRGLESRDPDFVGRQIELARATAVLRSERPRALVVRGPGGMGKSAFCRELGRVAQDDGWLVVSVTASEARVPYAPLADVVERLQARDDSILDALGARGRAVVAELGAPAPATEAGAALTRHQVIGALRRLLLAAGGGAPVVLVVDDAHLADEATIDVLQHIAPSAGTPLLPALAFRAEPAPDGLVRAVARLVRAGKAVEIDLEPLDHEESAALVAAGTRVPRAREVVDRIVALGEGNPFLTLELARSPTAAVPALVGTASDAIAARFLDLDEGSTAALRRLALASDDLDPAAVAALTSLPEEQTNSLLDTALAAGILVVAGARYRFRHDLVRQALVEQLAPHERQAAHRSSARRLADAGAASGLVARHWLEGERPDEAMPWLLDAARCAMRLGAYADVLGYLEPLLEHEAEHGEALCMRAEALDARGVPEALPAYELAAAVVGEPESHNLRAKQALATVKQGDPAGALETIAGAEPTSTDGLLSQALTYAGCAALGATDPAMGTAKAAEARRMALRAGDSDAAAIAAWAHAAAAHARGELRDTVEADLRETSALPRLAVSVFDGQLCMTQRLLYGARPYEDVIAWADALASEAKRLGAARGEAFAVTIRGEAKLLSGDLDGADADLAEGAVMHQEIGAATGEAFALQRRAEVALYRGDRDRAGELLEAALTIASESDAGFHLLDRIYGTRILLAPDGDAALAALEEAEEAVRGPVETCPGCRITLAVPAAIAAARGGDMERFEQWEQASDFLANVVMRLPAWDAAFTEVHAFRALAAGDDGEARDLFRTAAEGFAAAGQPLDEARCLAASGG